jgi:hypothetical protein
MHKCKQVLLSLLLSLLLLLQALQFLVLPHKGLLSLEQFSGQVCPSTLQPPF